MLAFVLDTGWSRPEHADSMRRKGGEPVKKKAATKQKK
jgi:hypothetical protein